MDKEFENILNRSLIDKIKDKFYFNIYIKFRIFLDIKRGYIEKNGEPIKCDNCKTTKLENYNEYNLDGYGTDVVEYSVKCSNCEKHLGTCSYGHWLM